MILYPDLPAVLKHCHLFFAKINFFRRSLSVKNGIGKLEKNWSKREGGFTTQRWCVTRQSGSHFFASKDLTSQNDRSETGFKTLDINTLFFASIGQNIPERVNYIIFTIWRNLTNVVRLWSGVEFLRGRVVGILLPTLMGPHVEDCGFSKNLTVTNVFYMCKIRKC